MDGWRCNVNSAEGLGEAFSPNINGFNDFLILSAAQQSVKLPPDYIIIIMTHLGVDIFCYAAEAIWNTLFRFTIRAMKEQRCVCYHS